MLGSVLREQVSNSPISNLFPRPPPKVLKIPPNLPINHLQLPLVANILIVMTVSENLCRLKRIWLLTPVAVLCCASYADGGLAIGLADAKSEQLLCEAASSCHPEPCANGEGAIENRSERSACTSSVSSDNVEQFGDLAASRLFAPAGARTALEWCRVTSNYVNPPPLSVPIHPT